MSTKNWEERFRSFMSRVNKIPDGCWEWTGTISLGYGHFYFKNFGSCRAHRYSYEYFKGEIPDGLVIDHLCRNKSCVNPEHLEAVTNKENVMRGTGPTSENARKMECHRGHPLSGKNLIIRRKDGYRSCRTCQYLHQNRYRLIAKERAISDYERGRKDAWEEMREKIRGMRKPLWSDDVYQHNRNIERENVLNELEASLQDPTT